MKKLILIAIGLAASGAFIGFDAIHAFFNKTRTDVRAQLMNPEVELQAQLSSAKELAEKCAESVINGRLALARVDSMLRQRKEEHGRRGAALARDRHVLETRQSLLRENNTVYLVGNERVSRRTLNRDALLRAKAFVTDREVHEHLGRTLDELKSQRLQTASEIEQAVVEQARLEGEITSLKAELENLKARRAVARTREEAKYLFDRSTFDKARDKIAEIRATIAEQNQRLDIYGRFSGARKGLIPADVDSTDEDGAAAIASVLESADTACEERVACEEEAVAAAAAYSR